MAGLLSADTMTAMRAQATASLDQSCILRTFAASTVDAEGGDTPGVATDTTVACRKATPSGREREIASRLGKEVDVVFTLPYGTTVPDTAQIVHSSGTFEKVDVNLRQSYQTAVRVAGKQVA